MPMATDSRPKICSRCVLDTTVPDLRFDSAGVCHYCKIHDELDHQYPLTEQTQRTLQAIVQEVKRKGKGKPYDVIVGVSGGRDSTWSLYRAIELGLRPLAVHFDNGWNSEIAVSNIKKATDKLGVDLFTYVVDWEEFKDLQISFLKASVPDAEIPTDVGIHGVLHKVAAREGVRYIIMAHSFRTEGIAPLSWTYMDGHYIQSVQKIFGSKPLKTYPNFYLKDYFYYNFVKGIKVIPLLAFEEYHQKQIDQTLKEKLDWEYYGGHHHESYYTHFFQSYYLPKKFDIDKRKSEYSALIRSGQTTREEVLQDLENNPYPYDEELVKYTISKLGLSEEDFKTIMETKPKSFHDYPTYYPFLSLMKPFIKLAVKLGLVPNYLYLKFFG